MIASISGIVHSFGKDHVVLGVGGIGIRVFVPRNVLERVEGPGRTLRLHTHLVVRETELALYGFESEEDLKLFEILLDVNGVGPKVGLAILSTLSPDVLKVLSPERKRLSCNGCPASARRPPSGSCSTCATNWT